MKKATIKARILKLNDGFLTMRDIADIVGCRPEYCRVVIRQRKGRGTSDIDRRYLVVSQFEILGLNERR